MKNLLTLLFLGTLLVQCKTKEATTKETSQQETPAYRENSEAGMYCNDLFEKLTSKKNFVKVRIESESIKESCLCVTFTYSGCARASEYAALFDGDFDPAARPEVNIHIYNVSTGACDQLITDSACFSLKRLQLVGNEVLVSVNGGNQELLYVAPSID